MTPPKRILIVDDEENIGRSLRLILEREGYHVAVCLTIADAKAYPQRADAYLLDIPPQLGIRETRRIIAETMLTGDDVLGCARFDDAIGVNGWPLEKHVAGNVL